MPIGLPACRRAEGVRRPLSPPPRPPRRRPDRRRRHQPHHRPTPAQRRRDAHQNDRRTARMNVGATKTGARRQIRLHRFRSRSDAAPRRLGRRHLQQDAAARDALHRPDRRRLPIVQSPRRRQGLKAHDPVRAGRRPDVGQRNHPLSATTARPHGTIPPTARCISTCRRMPPPSCRSTPPRRAGMPVPAPATKSPKPNVYKIDFPVKPGETRFDLTYSFPYKIGDRSSKAR